MIYLKILFKNLGFGGGAPKSLLEYIKVAKKNNFDVVVVGEFTQEPKDYIENNIKIIDLEYFEIKKPFKSLLILKNYLEIIKEERPIIIHTITEVNCYFHKIISKVTNIPIIYNIPAGKVNKFTAKVMGDEELLVFSEENKLELIKNGYNENKITVISNRMDTSNSNDKFLDHYNQIRNRDLEIKFLLISRLSDDKFKSVKYIINLVKKLNKDKYNVKLDVLGDGKHFNYFVERAKEVNKEFNREVILLHGFKHNVLDFIEESHFVFGKGRSVLDGILNSRISFVVSEEDTICHCNLKTFDNLRTYNFAGRNLEYESSYHELIDLITKLVESNIDLNYLKELKNVTRKYYDIEFAEKKILNLYKITDNTNINYNPSAFNVIKEFILLYYRMYKIRSNIKNMN